MHEIFAIDHRYFTAANESQNVSVIWGGDFSSVHNPILDFALIFFTYVFYPISRWLLNYLSDIVLNHFSYISQVTPWTLRPGSNWTVLFTPWTLWKPILAWCVLRSCTASLLSWEERTLWKNINFLEYISPLVFVSRLNNLLFDNKYQCILNTSKGTTKHCLPVYPEENLNKFSVSPMKLFTTRTSLALLTEAQ